MMRTQKSQTRLDYSGEEIFEEIMAKNFTEVIKVIIPQKVYDETPIVELANKTDISAAVYINMEQFAYSSVRDEYNGIIQRMIEQLGVPCRTCRNLAELKRWQKREFFNHVFISLLEYQEDPIFFDKMCRKKSRKHNPAIIAEVLLRDSFSEAHIKWFNFKWKNRIHHVNSFCSLFIFYGNRCCFVVNENPQNVFE